MNSQGSDNGAQFRPLADQLPVMVWSTDHAMCLTSISGGALTTLGRKREDLLGICLPDYMGPVYGEVVLHAHLKALAGESCKYESEWRERWYESHVGPMRSSDGEIVGAIGIAIDITERRRAEQERARLEDKLRRQHKLEALGQLASGLAHEINNPLQSIINFAQLIRARNQDPSTRDYAEGIAHEVQSLGAIVRNLQSLIHQKAELPVELRMRELVHGTLSLFGAMLRKDGIVLDVEIGSELRPAWGNAHGVQQVLINLLMAARDAVTRHPGSDPELRRISMRATTVTHQERSFVRLTVEHKQPEARSSEESPTPPRELGLSISEEMAHFNAGELIIESSADQRRAFHLLLPLASEQ